MSKNIRDQFYKAIDDSFEYDSPNDTLIDKCESIADTQAIEALDAVGYNYDYVGDGKWTRKEFDDEPLIDVRQYTTKELLLKFKAEHYK